MKFENKGKWMRQILESAELDSPENEETALDLDESAQTNEAMPPVGQRKRIDFEDDIVKVYDGNKEIYAGAEDYEPMKDENWKWDNTNKYYKFGKYIKVCCESAQVNEDNPYEKEWHEYVNGVKGSFAKHLANAFQQADMNNLRKLHSAFPEISKKFWLWKTVGEKEKP